GRGPGAIAELGPGVAAVVHDVDRPVRANRRAIRPTPHMSDPLDLPVEADPRDCAAAHPDQDDTAVRHHVGTFRERQAFGNYWAEPQSRSERHLDPRDAPRSFPG